MTDKKIIDIFILDVEDEHINYAVEYTDGTTKTFRRKTKAFDAYFESDDIIYAVTVGKVYLGVLNADARIIFIVTHKDMSKEILVVKEGRSSCNELLLISQKSARKPFPPKYSDNVKYGIADDEEVYIFLGVSFDGSEKYYFYLADDDCYEIGDKVVVPAGPDNIETVGEVVTVQKHRRKTAPFQIEKTKYVIERAVDDYEI